MNTAFLDDTLLQDFGKREIARTEVPNIIIDILKSGFRIKSGYYL